MFPRLGYACINMVSGLSVNRTCTAKTLRTKGLDYGISLAKQNLVNVAKILEWNYLHGIHVYRMSSDMFPHMTNPEFLNGRIFAYEMAVFQPELDEIANAMKKYNQRLTFHPGQFNQIGSPNAQVVENTIRDLLAHATILDALECDLNSVLVVHGGGVYGDKSSTLTRWVDQFYQLPSAVQRRIVIENDERGYSYADMLWLSERIHRPVVFDTHHHNCYSLYRPLPEPEFFIEKIIETWTCLNLRPKFHVSEQAPNKRLGAHSNYVKQLPLYLYRADVDVMVEAKAKEQAVLQLYSTYCTFDFDQNLWIPNSK